MTRHMTIWDAGEAPRATAGAPNTRTATARPVARTLLLSLVIAAGVSGCAALPTNAPTTAEVSAAADREDSPQPFDIVEMSAEIVAAAAEAEAAGFAEALGNGTGASFRISPGDTLRISVFETAAGGQAGGLFAVAQTGAVGVTQATLPPLVVPSRGHVTIPYVGEVHVAGLTADGLARVVQNGLAEQAIDPQVVVSVDKPASNAVTVIGDAGAGGIVQLRPGTDRLTDAIAATGGVTAPTHEVVVRVARAGRQHEMRLSGVLDQVEQNIRLSPSDRITLERRPGLYVSIGAFGVNALQPVGKAPFTLMDAIGANRGLIDGLADPDGVYVLRVERGAETAPRAVAYQFRMRDLSGAFLARRFDIRPGDIIFTANAPSTVVRKFFGVFSGFTGQAGAVSSLAQ
ncbi:MAG: polysaccharide biosynthesis/export family protein [Pseudomonadota bacterium]